MIEIETEKIRYGGEELPLISVSASTDASGKLNLTITNCSLDKTVPVKIDAGGTHNKLAGGQILTGPAMNSHNTFEQPDLVKPEAFTQARVQGEAVEAEIPPMSVVLLTLE